jgi:hypothetical protein
MLKPDQTSKQSLPQVTQAPAQVNQLPPQVIQAPAQVTQLPPQVVQAPAQATQLPPQVIQAPAQVTQLPPQIIQAIDFGVPSCPPRPADPWIVLAEVQTSKSGLGQIDNRVRRIVRSPATA